MIAPEMPNKRSSYPSRQLRGGPAPLASFEDLSDEISSPEDPETEQRGGHTKDDGDEAEKEEEEDEDDAPTYSDGATPSTPRVLAQTPSTPLALDNSFSIGTPDSLDGRSFVNSARDVGGSSTSRAESPCFHFGEATAAALTVAAANEDQVTVDEQPRELKKCGASTPSPRTARKLFTMSLFKPRTEDGSPSPMKSPSSPRRLSPPAISPKSPRRLSPFSGLFKSGKDHLETATSSTEQPSGSLPPTSPTKRKGGHFSHFLRPKDQESKKAPHDSSSVKKDGAAARYTNVFANLFRKGDVQVGGRSVTSPTALPTTEDKGYPIAGTTEGETERLSSSKLDAPLPLPGSAAINRDVVDVETGAMSIDRNVFDSTHDIVQNLECDPNLRLGISPSADIHSTTAPFLDSQKLSAAADIICEELPPSPADGVDDRTSPTESEAGEAADETDPTLLKTGAKGDEPEAETLLREDSFELEEFGSEDVEATSLTEKTEQTVVTKHKDKIASFRTNPLERPRSTVPVSFASLDAYINIVATRRRPTPNLKVKADSETATDLEKLKVILPGEEFEHKARQSKKPGVYKSWFEFCEDGLQSPRTRRRLIAGGNERASSAPSATRGACVSASERCKLADVTFSASSDAWVTFDPISTNSPKRIKEDAGQVSAKFTSKSLPRPPKLTSSITLSSSSSSDSCQVQPEVQKCADEHNRSSSSSSRPSSNSSGESSPIKLPDAIVPVDDDEVEPLVGSALVPQLSPTEYFLPSNGDFSKDWTLTTTFSTDDVHQMSSVPDCVASASIRQDEVGHDDLANSPSSDFLNGGIDLLASIPPMTKYPSDGSTVSSGSFRRPAPSPPRAPPGGVRSSITSHENM